jgi:hypothetical protein
MTVPQKIRQITIITQISRGPSWGMRGIRGANDRDPIQKSGRIAIKMLVNIVAMNSEALSIIMG